MNNKNWEEQLDERHEYNNLVDNTISNIEEIRRQNNVNWCSILKIALKKAPEETKALISGINEMDNQISQELSKLI